MRGCLSRSEARAATEPCKRVTVEGAATTPERLSNDNQTDIGRGFEPQKPGQAYELAFQG